MVVGAASSESHATASRRGASMNPGSQNGWPQQSSRPAAQQSHSPHSVGTDTTVSAAEPKRTYASVAARAGASTSPAALQTHGAANGAQAAVPGRAGSVLSTQAASNPFPPLEPALPGHRAAGKAVSGSSGGSGGGGGAGIVGRRADDGITQRPPAAIVGPAPSLVRSAPAWGSNGTHAPAAYAPLAFTSGPLTTGAGGGAAMAAATGAAGRAAAGARDPAAVIAAALAAAHLIGPDLTGGRTEAPPKGPAASNEAGHQQTPQDVLAPSSAPLPPPPQPPVGRTAPHPAAGLPHRPAGSAAVAGAPSHVAATVAPPVELPTGIGSIYHQYFPSLVMPSCAICQGPLLLVPGGSMQPWPLQPWPLLPNQWGSMQAPDPPPGLPPQPSQRLQHQAHQSARPPGPQPPPAVPPVLQGQSGDAAQPQQPQQQLQHQQQLRQEAQPCAWAPNGDSSGVAGGLPLYQSMPQTPQTLLLQHQQLTMQQPSQVDAAGRPQTPPPLPQSRLLQSVSLDPEGAQDAAGAAAAAPLGHSTNASTAQQDHGGSAAVQADGRTNPPPSSAPHRNQERQAAPGVGTVRAASQREPTEGSPTASRLRPPDSPTGGQPLPQAPLSPYGLWHGYMDGYVGMWTGYAHAMQWPHVFAEPGPQPAFQFPAPAPIPVPWVAGVPMGLPPAAATGAPGLAPASAPGPWVVVHGGSPWLPQQGFQVPQRTMGQPASSPVGSHRSKGAQTAPSAFPPSPPPPAPSPPPSSPSEGAAPGGNRLSQPQTPPRQVRGAGEPAATSARSKQREVPTQPFPAGPVACLAPAAACEWILAGGLDELQRAWVAGAQKALAGVLRKDAGDVTVSESVDFGVRAICEDGDGESPTGPAAPAAGSTQAASLAQLSTGAAGGSAAAGPAGPAGAGGGRPGAAGVSVLHATLRIHNKRSDCVLLLNVRAVPQYRHCLRLRDQMGVAVQNPALALKRKRAAAAVPAAAATAAVLLGPGAEYSVEVVLDLRQAAFAGRGAERGLLTQLVLFTLVYDKHPTLCSFLASATAIASTSEVMQALPPGGWVAMACEAAGLPPLNPARMSYASAASPRVAAPRSMSSYATVVARRVSVAVVDRRQLMEMKSLLKVTAPPFVPAALRQLFSSVPARLHACPETVAQGLFRYEGAGSVLNCAALAAYFAASPLAFRALAMAVTELPPPPPDTRAGPLRAAAATAVAGLFGYLPPTLMVAANGQVQPSTELTASSGINMIHRRSGALSVAVSASAAGGSGGGGGDECISRAAAAAAVALAWAQAGGVGRPAVARLEGLLSFMRRAAEAAGVGLASWQFGQAKLQKEEPAWRSEWGKQLGLSGKYPMELAGAVKAAGPALEDVYAAAAAAAAAAGGAAAASAAAGGGRGSGDRNVYASLDHQRSEMVRYGKLLVDEEEVMETDIRRFNLYNARIRVAVFNPIMTSYRVLNWLPPEPPPAGTQGAAPNPAVPGGLGGGGSGETPAGVSGGTAAEGPTGAAAPAPREGLGGPDALAQAAERPYRGPRLTRLCAVPVGQAQAEWEPEGRGDARGGAGGGGKVKAKGKKAAAALGGGQEGQPHRLLAAVVDVPGLVEGRPQLVAGDVVYVRLEAKRDVEYAAQLLTVDGGQVLLVMPPEYWSHLRVLAATPSSPLLLSPAPSLSAAQPAAPAADAAAASAASAAASSAVAAAAPAAPLAHCCFTFDRTPFGRMHDALLRAALRPELLLPPPPPAEAPAPKALEGGGKASLPDLPDDLYQSQPAAAGPSGARARGPVAAPAAAAAPGSGRNLKQAEGAPDAALAKVAAGLRLVGGTALNPEQRLACAAVLRGAGRDLPFVLFGPPGTGKTVTLVECALQILAEAGVGPTAASPPAGAAAGSGAGSTGQHGVRLLLTAPQNYSADLIASSLAAALGPAVAGNKRLLRLNDPRRRIVEAKADVLPYCLVEESTASFRLPTPAEVRGALVVVCSCSSAGLLREGTHLREAVTAASALLRASKASAAEAAGGGGAGVSGAGWGGGKRVEFSHVMIDEAGQALLPEALIPLTLRAPGGVAMLCGDPRQLEPVVRSMSAARGGLSTSLLELLMDAAEREGHLQRARAAAAEAQHLLDGTLRSHQDTPHGHRRPGAQDAAAAVPAGANAAGSPPGARAAAVGLGPSPEMLRGVMLVRNYRSAAPLLDLPSRLFYDKQLQACVDRDTSRAPEWELLMPPAGANTPPAAAPALAPASPTLSAAASVQAGPVARTSSASPHVGPHPHNERADAARGAQPAAAKSPVTSTAHSSQQSVSTSPAAAAARFDGHPPGPTVQAIEGNGTEAEIMRTGRGLGNAGVPRAATMGPLEDNQEDDEAEAGPVAPAHMMFFGVRGQQFQDLDTPSFFNPLEASTVADLVESLIRASWAAATLRLEAQRQAQLRGGPAGSDSLSGVVAQHHIGIICTYRKQVFKLRQLLRDRGLGGVRVGTVDDYQGQEERIVFISTVLSRVESLPGTAQAAALCPDGADAAASSSPLPSREPSTVTASAVTGGGGGGDDGSHPFGLWSHPRRFNVAVTRSRALLVVVGHPAVLLADKYWRELVRQCVARGTYRGAGEAQVRNRMRQGPRGLAASNVNKVGWQPSPADKAAGGSSGGDSGAAALLPPTAAAADARAGGQEGNAGAHEAGAKVGSEDPNAPALPVDGKEGEQAGRGASGGGAYGQTYDMDDNGSDMAYCGSGVAGEEGEEEPRAEDEDEELLSEEEGEAPDAEEMAALVQQLAEATTLGLGCEDEIYPDQADLQAYYEHQAAYFEEMPFRVQL